MGGGGGRCRWGRGVGDTLYSSCFLVGDAGSAVCTALLRTKLLFEGETRGEDTLRRDDGSGVGDGGDAGGLAREYSLLCAVGTNPLVAGRESGPAETTLALGEEDEEDIRAMGDAARPVELEDDSAGETGRLLGGEVVRAAEVAW